MERLSWVRMKKDDVEIMIHADGRVWWSKPIPNDEYYNFETLEEAVRHFEKEGYTTVEFAGKT